MHLTNSYGQYNQQNAAAEDIMYHNLKQPRF